MQHQLYGQLLQLNCKDILNRTDVAKSLKIANSLLHLTSFLQDDTTNMLTEVYHKSLNVKEEKVMLNSRQSLVSLSS